MVSTLIYPTIVRDPGNIAIRVVLTAISYVVIGWSRAKGSTMCDPENQMGVFNLSDATCPQAGLGAIGAAL